MAVFKVIFFHCSHHGLLAHASLNAVSLLVFRWVWITTIPHASICWHVVLCVTLFRLIHPRAPLCTMYLCATGSPLTISLQHLLLLGGHIAPVELLKDVVFDIRILLHCYWRRLSKFRTCLVELVGGDTTRALGLYFHLA